MSLKRLASACVLYVVLLYCVLNLVSVLPLCEGKTFNYYSNYGGDLTGTVSEFCRVEVNMFGRAVESRAKITKKVPKVFSLDVFRHCFADMENSKSYRLVCYLYGSHPTVSAIFCNLDSYTDADCSAGMVSVSAQQIALPAYGNFHIGNGITTVTVRTEC
jgi:hypothetical protein